MATVKAQVDYEYKVSGTSKAARAMQTVGHGATMAAAAWAAAMAAMYVTASKMASAGAEIYDTASRLNLSVETIQALGYVADQTGSDLQGLAGSIRALNSFMLQADRATSDQAKALTELGLRFEDISAMNPEQAFLALTDALGGVDDEMRQNVLAASIFGNRFGTQVVGALNQTDGSLRTLMESFAESGRAMSTEQITALKKYDDAMTDVEYSIKALTADAIVPLLPKMQAIADKAITMATENMPTFIKSAEALGTALLAVAEAALKVSNNFINLGENIGGGLARAWMWVSGASQDYAIAEQMADQAAQRVLELQMAGQLTGAGQAAGLSLLAQATQDVTDAAVEAAAAMETVGGGGPGRPGGRSELLQKEIVSTKELMEMDRERAAQQISQLQAFGMLKDSLQAKDEAARQREYDQMQERMEPLLSAAQRSTDIIVNSFTGGFDSVIDGFKSMLMDMAKQWAKSQIFNLIFSGATGGAGKFLPKF